MSGTYVQVASHADLINAYGFDENHARYIGGVLRMPVRGHRPNDLRGWLAKSDNGVEWAGCFGEDTKYVFDPNKQNGRKLSRAEIEAAKMRAARERLRRQLEEERKNQAAAETAKKVYYSALDHGAAYHPYVLKKGINGPGIGSLRVFYPDQYKEITGKYPFSDGQTITAGRLLVVPIEKDRQIRTVQIITADGAKSFLSGASTKGCFWSARRLPPKYKFRPYADSKIRLIVGEGVATVLSFYQYLELWRLENVYPIAALNCGNLEPVCKNLRESYPAAQIDLLADIDRNGIGLKEAEKARIYARGGLYLPPFTADLYLRYQRLHGPDSLPTDWNDFFSLLTPYELFKTRLKSLIPSTDHNKREKL
jgi:putative DNA primase/helicase